MVEAFKNKDADYHNGEYSLSLLPDGSIPKSSLILTGTGAGVLFRYNHPAARYDH